MANCMKPGTEMNANIEWLNNYPIEQQKHLAEVYVSVMQEDIERLASPQCDKATALQIIHRIKGGLASIGDHKLEKTIKIQAQALEAGDVNLNEFSQVVTKSISHNIQSIIAWLENFDVGN